MCGVMGLVSQRDVVDPLISGLGHLEYRGYDSTGIATINQAHHLQYCRTAGKLQALKNRLEQYPLTGTIGIAHNRWATHGKPNEQNAHPQCADAEVAVVHNGIIENYLDLRTHLIQQGCRFRSETDTEVLPWLLHQALKQYPDILQATRAVVKQLKGTFSIIFLARQAPTRLIAVCRGSPLIIGLGIGENFIASDPIALSAFTHRFIYLETHDIADISCHELNVYDVQGHLQSRGIHQSLLSSNITSKGHYRHYMQKEIAEQAQAIRSSLTDRTTIHSLRKLLGPQAQIYLAQVQHVQIVACGSSYHAGLIARYWLETLAGIPCQVDIASEFRYYPKPVSPNTLLVTLSQSGETADTLGALRTAKQHQKYLATLAICNIAESSLVRESDFVLLTHAGPEIGVAATKTFLTQLSTLMLFTLAIGEYHLLGSHQRTKILKQLKALPQAVEQTLQLEPHIQQIAAHWVDKQHSLLIARGLAYPIAMEAALKLKELTYLHAEAYPAGELKHGSLALLDHNIPIIALAPDDTQLEKLQSNIQAVLARAGKMLIFAGEQLVLPQPLTAVEIIRLPKIPTALCPFLYIIPLQLLAYHIACLKGLDVDQPRHLAKSVTVE